MRNEETVYTGRNNTIELALTVNGTGIVHNALTRVQVTVGATVLDSATAPALFDFTQADRLILKFGSAGLAAGRHTATLVVYDATHALGLVWDTFVIVVK